MVVTYDQIYTGIVHYNDAADNMKVIVMILKLGDKL